MNRSALSRFLVIADWIGCDFNDTSDTRTSKRMLVMMSLILIPLSLVGVPVYAALGYNGVAAVVVCFAGISSLSLLHLHRTRQYRLFQFTQLSLIYDLWGDTVNVASRMESHGTSGKIQITGATRKLLEAEFMCDARGKIEIDGKGEMETWYLVGRKPVAEAEALVQET